MEIDNENNEDTNNKSSRNRDKKIVETNKNMDEQTRQHIKQMKLCYLEDDDVGHKEEKNVDEDYAENEQEEKQLREIATDLGTKVKPAKKGLFSR